MDALSAIVSVAVFVAVIIAAIKLTQRWQFLEAQERDAEAWGYLGWDGPELIELYNKFVDIIAGGDRKPRYFRSLEAIAAALAMKQRLSATQIKSPIKSQNVVSSSESKPAG